MDSLNVMNEHQAGWLSVILYQRWTGSYAVAKYDNKHRRFVGTITVCTGGIWHANREFNKMVAAL